MSYKHGGVTAGVLPGPGSIAPARACTQAGYAVPRPRRGYRKVFKSIQLDS